MTHKHDPIQALKAICQTALHERHACTQGYKELMQATDAEQIACVWQKYWRELISEQYADIICAELPHHYDEVKEGFNKTGLYFNECPQAPFLRSFVIVGNSDTPIHVYGQSHVYLLGNAHVIAHDSANVNCTQPNGRITLLSRSTGNVSAGYAIARERSWLYASSDCECHEASHVYITHGTLTDYGHAQINASDDAVVISPSPKPLTQ